MFKWIRNILKRIKGWFRIGKKTASVVGGEVFVNLPKTAKRVARNEARIAVCKIKMEILDKESPEYKSFEAELNRRLEFMKGVTKGGSN